MFAGFKLKIDQDSKLYDDKYYQLGKKIEKERRRTIEESLENFSIDGVIDGTSLQEEWFPQINANIFLSHLHKDKKLAYCIVGWLSHHFKLEAFVDSNVWGFADDLLKQVDNKYCVLASTQGKSYSYEKRNYSTSHIHMMLSVALSKMIDRTECLFFLNTPESVSIEDTVQNSTFSPWIYSEVVTSRIVRKQALSRYRKKIVGKRTVFESEELKVKYNIFTKHLIALNDKDLISWMLQKPITSGLDSLDQLYVMKGLLEK